MPKDDPVVSPVGSFYVKLLREERKDVRRLEDDVEETITIKHWGDEASHVWADTFADPATAPSDKLCKARISHGEAFDLHTWQVGGEVRALINVREHRSVVASTKDGFFRSIAYLSRAAYAVHDSVYVDLPIKPTHPDELAPPPGGWHFFENDRHAVGPTPGTITPGAHGKGSILAYMRGGRE